MHPEHPGVILQGEIVDIPYIVIDQLTPDQQQVWKTYFGDADRPRYIEEASGAVRRRRPRPNRAAGRPPTTPGGGSSTTATGTAWSPPPPRRPSA